MSAAAIVTMLAGSSMVSTISAFMVSAPPFFTDVARSSPSGAQCATGVIERTSRTELVATLGGSSCNGGTLGPENCCLTRSSLRSDQHCSRPREEYGRRSTVARADRYDSESPDFAGTSSTDHDEPPMYRRTQRSREHQLIRHSSTTSTSECKNAPTEDNAWRQSVFEFKGLNDPQTNLASNTRQQTSDDAPDAMRSAAQTKESKVKAGPSSIEDALFSGNTEIPDWFQFREKEALRRAEVDETVKELRGSHSATVDLATQLGLPAKASFEEIRAAYRQEIKRCHPDAAGVASNEFRLKALERRYQRLTSSWDAFVSAHQDPSRYPGPVNGSDPKMNAVAAAVAKRAARQQAEDEPSASTDSSEESMDVGSSSC